MFAAKAHAAGAAPRERRVLAVDLGGTKVAAAVVTATGRILNRTTQPVDRSSPLAPVEQIERLARELAGASPKGASEPYAAAGIAVPGLVRPTGTVWAPNLPGWERMPLAREARRRLAAPVAVESDRNAAVLGEAWRGAARGASDAVVLVVGTGIGAGILSGGSLVRGAHELAGCAGWMVVAEEKSGEVSEFVRLEDWAAGPGVARAASAVESLSAKSKTALDVADAARDGDRQAQRVFERVGTLLGLAVANLISLFDPRVVVVGGGLAGAADLYFDTLKRTALERCQPIAARRVRLVVSRLGPDANLLGAARIALAGHHGG